jgi:tRNA threonylcarbamoyladenosine biosynthesis protein TsaE
MSVKFPTKGKEFTIESKSVSQTKKLGKILAEESLRTFTSKALVFGLIGDLGGGKTTFLQGFAKGLGLREKILSPTFVIMRKFKIENSKSKIKNFYHIDCYRIKNTKEMLNLGFKEMISDPQNLIVIEWADRIKRMLPPDALILKFDFVDQKTRKITVVRGKGG